MVQAADFGKLHNLSCDREFDTPAVGCVLVQREVGTRLMVMGEISGEDAAEVSLAEKGRSRHCSLVDGELLAQGQVLEAELAVAADDEGEEPKQAAEEGDHKPR